MLRGPRHVELAAQPFNFTFLDGERLIQLGDFRREVVISALQPVELLFRRIDSTARAVPQPNEGIARKENDRRTARQPQME